MSPISSSVWLFSFPGFAARLLPHTAFESPCRMLASRSTLNGPARHGIFLPTPSSISPHCTASALTQSKWISLSLTQVDLHRPPPGSPASFQTSRRSSGSESSSPPSTLKAIARIPPFTVTGANATPLPRLPSKHSIPVRPRPVQGSHEIPGHNAYTVRRLSQCVQSK